MRQPVIYVAMGFSILAFVMFMVTGSGWALAVQILSWIVMLIAYLRKGSDV